MTNGISYTRNVGLFLLPAGPSQDGVNVVPGDSWK